MQRRRPLPHATGCWLACALVAGISYGATPPPRQDLEVELSVVHAVREPVPVTIEVAAKSSEDATRIEAEAPGSIAVAVPGPRPWTVRVASADYWSAPVTVEDGDPTSDLHIPLWIATTVAGRIHVPDGIEAPRAVTLRLASHEGAKRPRIEPTTLVCPVDGDGRFRCTVPRLHNADLRFRVPGFASRFFWDIDLDQERTRDIGTLRLRPGASVIGTVVLASRGDVRDARLELFPARRSPYAGRAVEPEPPTTGGHPNDRGFFSLEGLDPGIYRLVAQHPQAAATEIAPIRVLVGAQTRLEEPIALAPGESLRISVKPPFDPEKQDWTLRIYRGTGEDERASSPMVEAVTAGGYLETEALALGTYEVDVQDATGQRMHRARIVHGESSGIHSLKVSSILVDGTITLGDEPLLARLTFRRLDVGLTVESDLDGRFRLRLPMAGTWDVEVRAPFPEVRWRRRDIEIEPAAGRVELEIRLPDTRVGGIVVDEEGRPRDGATVTIGDLVYKAGPVHIETDETGRFAFYGLQEDRYRIVATYAQEFSSEPRELDVREGSEPELRLVLQRNRFAEGSVLDSAGSALPGTWLLAEAVTATGLRVPFQNSVAATDSRGRFRFALRPSTARVALTVLAPGFGAKSASLTAGSDTDIIVDSRAGSMVVELPTPVASWTETSQPLPVVIAPNGQMIAFGALARWAGMNGMANDHAGTRFTFPALAPGPYQVCWLMPAELVEGAAPRSVCTGGDVTAGGSTLLRLPALD